MIYCFHWRSVIKDDEAWRPKSQSFHVLIHLPLSFIVSVSFQLGSPPRRSIYLVLSQKIYQVYIPIYSVLKRPNMHHIQLSWVHTRYGSRTCRAESFLSRSSSHPSYMVNLNIHRCWETQNFLVVLHLCKASRGATHRGPQVPSSP